MLRFWLTRQRRIPFSIHTLLFFSLFVGITRGVLEHILFGIDARATDVLAFIPFYLSLPFIYAGVLSLIPGISYERTLQPVTFATLLGLLPPLLDFLLISHQTHSVFYGYFITNDFSEFPWLGYNPKKKYPVGEAITIWLTFFFAAVYTRVVTKNTGKTILAVLAAYFIFLIYSLIIPILGMFLLFQTLPSTDELNSYSFSEKRQIVYAIAIVQIFVAWLIDALKSVNYKRYVLRILHFAPFLMGTILGCLHAQAPLRHSLFAALITITSGFIAAAHNDFQYGLTAGAHNPVYRHGLLANYFAVALYAMVLFAGYKFALLGIACFALSVLYHYPFYAARNTAFGAMKIEGFWGMFTYLTGAMAGQVIFPDYKIIAFAFVFWGGFSLFSIVKDAKDIRQDYREGRNTVYTFLFKRKISLSMFQKIFSVILSLLLLICGFLYYRTSLAFAGHLFLTAMTFLGIWKSHKSKFFYLFLITIVCQLGLLIFHGVYK